VRQHDQPPVNSASTILGSPGGDAIRRLDLHSAVRGSSLVEGVGVFQHAGIEILTDSLMLAQDDRLL
jgi:hypothetical protein